VLTHALCHPYRLDDTGDGSAIGQIHTRQQQVECKGVVRFYSFLKDIELVVAKRGVTQHVRNIVPPGSDAVEERKMFTLFTKEPDGVEEQCSVSCHACDFEVTLRVDD